APLADSPAPASLGGVDLTGFSQILADNKLTVRQWIHKTPAELAKLEQRAVAHSGRAQPDLAGMMVIEGVDPARLSDIAWTINELPEIEFAWIELVPILHQCGPDAPGPCNIPGPSCDEGFGCNPDPGNQFDAAEYGCQDQSCCETVTAQIPYCNNEDSPNGWDVVCAGYANILCNGTIYDNINPTLPPPQRYDPCFSADGPTAGVPEFEVVVPGIQLGGCFEAHPGRGCSQPTCCFAVCNIDPSCCNIEWDQVCVNLASSPVLGDACIPTGGDDPTPSFDPVLDFPGTNGTVGGALYTQRARTDPEYIPADPTDPIRFPGSPLYTGEGLALTELVELQAEIASTFQNNGPTLTYGETLRVAIIEFSAFVNHEDFTLDANGDLLPVPRVISEPGQSLILYEGSNNAPQHGTATLGEVVAADNGFGVTGIARNAQGYFFPIVSFEEGSRPQSAITSCFQTFEAGDVVNHSWGFGGGNCLPAVAPYGLLISLGTDLGITSVVSAGNSNVAINPQAVEFDSGVIIVGACTPGRIAQGAPGCPGFEACQGFYYRLPFSNFSGEQTPDPNGRDLAAVHISAWGNSVVTVGYGDLFRGNNPTPPGGDPQQENQLRTYSARFNGTSSAAPIITGAVSCLQSAAKQIYGTPLTPINIRDIMGSNSRPQCPFAVSPPNQSDCCLVGDPDCDGEFRAISGFPQMYDCGVGLFTGTGWDGNPTDIRVVTGLQPAGAPWVSYTIRAEDGQFLRIESVRRRSGEQADGLTYLATGGTTDLLARLKIEDVQNPVTQISDLGLTFVSRSTRNFVLAGVFVRNFQTNRYEYFGADFLTTISDEYNFDLPAYGGFAQYLDPATGRVEMRLWTCGLGSTSAHEIWHDLVEIRINDPLEPL
ncbi:MAG: S8 family serine peptidase, partial [Planctomycetota bacterium]